MRPRPASPATTARLRGDEGAVLVEAAIIAPFIAALVLGILEFGIAWGEGNAVERTSSDAGRTAATYGAHWRTDYEVLRTVQSSLAGADSLELQKVIVFNANAGGTVPAACTAIDPSGFGSFGVPNTCNVYSKEQVESDSLDGFQRGGTADAITCIAGSWDANWCPTGRDNQEPGRDNVGLYIEAEYTPVTGIMSGDVTIVRTAVFLIEPERVGGF